MQPQGGLSLVEIVVGLAILVIALGGIYGVVGQSVRSFGVSEDFLEVQQNARVALGKLAEEAKWAQAVAADSPTCPWPTCVELTIPADNPIKNPPAAYTVRFQWNSAAQQFERVEGVTTMPLANHITGVTFRYLDGNGVDTTVAANVLRVEAEIQVQRRSTSTRLVNSDVFLRNAVPTPAPGAGPPPGSSTTHPTPALGAPRPPPPPPPPTATATWTPTPVPTRTRTPTPVPTPTRTRTATPAPTPTVTPFPR